MTREEILAAPEGNLYDTVQRLRPGFLRARSTATVSNAFPVVYVNNQRRGSLDYLRGISNREVVQVRYLSAIDATTRYGQNVEAGVLEVTLVAR